MRTFASICFLFASSVVALAQINDTTIAEIRKMHWVPGEQVNLSASQSSISKMPDYNVLVGQEAIRALSIMEGNSNENLEAYAINMKNSGEVAYHWFPSGYIRADDWGDVNPDEFLDQIKKNDEIANETRVQKGLATLQTVGWRQEPRFNADSGTASWIIELVDNTGRHIMNSVALKLGRSEFEKITWIDDVNSPANASGFDLAQNSHRFNTGARHTDYIEHRQSR